MEVGAFFHSLVVVPMEVGLRSAASITGSGGVAIVAFTLAVRLLLLPLGLWQARSSRAVAALGPEMAALKERHRGDRERLGAARARLYQERGVQPVAGCLPLLLQMPVLYGLYIALGELSRAGAGAEPFREPFLWVPSLAQPDAFSIGGLHAPGFLALLTAAAQWAAASLAVPLGSAPEQQSAGRAAAVTTPVMMLFISTSVPAGLVLYWLVSSLIGLGQQSLIGPPGAGLTPRRGRVGSWLAGLATSSAQAEDIAAAEHEGVGPPVGPAARRPEHAGGVQRRR